MEIQETHKARAVIRQVSVVGHYKDAMKYTVGSPAFGSSNIITTIVESEYDALYFGVISYDIYVKNEKGDEILWASTKGIPCLVHYKS